MYYHLLYFATSFLFEEKLLYGFLERGVVKTLLSSRLLSLEYILLYYPLVALAFGPSLSSSEASLRDLCLNDRNCVRYLKRSPSPFPSMFRMSPTTATASSEGSFYTDGGDSQWNGFRSALPILLLFSIASMLASRAAGVIWPNIPKSRLNLLLGLPYVLYVHGSGTVFTISAAFLFYKAGRRLRGTPLHTPVIWTMAVLAIIAKEPNFPVKKHLTWSTFTFGKLGFLDKGKYCGEYGWHLSLNLVLLRLISFCIDGHNNLASPAASRLTTAADYTFENCLSHALYAPVFIAGPTVRFDDYIACCKKGSAKKVRRDGGCCCYCCYCCCCERLAVN